MLILIPFFDDLDVTMVTGFHEITPARASTSARNSGKRSVDFIRE